MSAPADLGASTAELGLATVRRHILLCAEPTKPKCCAAATSAASWEFLKRRLKELETRQRKASETFEKVKADREGAAHQIRVSLFQEDWRSYQKAKLGGAADSVLLDQVGRILREYRDAGVDLSEASLELRRLQRTK